MTNIPEEDLESGLDLSMLSQGIALAETTKDEKSIREELERINANQTIIKSAIVDTKSKLTFQANAIDDLARAVRGMNRSGLPSTYKRELDAATVASCKQVKTTIEAMSKDTVAKMNAIATSFDKDYADKIDIADKLLERRLMQIREATREFDKNHNCHHLSDGLFYALFINCFFGIGFSFIIIGAYFKFPQLAFLHDAIWALIVILVLLNIGIICCSYWFKHNP